MTQAATRLTGGLLVQPFPATPALVALAYRELHIASTGTKEQLQALGDPLLLPRPWDPATCHRPELREQLWAWLEEVVTWFNVEYVWDAEFLLPSCWPRHPHLVHDIAVIADQRRRAGRALTSEGLEEWHRYCVPSFLDRMKKSVKEGCDGDHQRWPARSRATRYENDRPDRAAVFAGDVDAVQDRDDSAEASRPRLGLVDFTTGEVVD